MATILKPSATSEQQMASDENAMMNQIQATHSPDGRELDVRFFLHLIEDIIRCTIPNPAVVNSKSEDKTQPSLRDIPEPLAFLISKISCEMSCKSLTGADAHATTMGILSMLSFFKWDAKAVLFAAAFAINYGEFWLVAQFYAKNQLAMEIAFLRQMPDIKGNFRAFESQFNALNKLIQSTLVVIKCIVEFMELPSRYISEVTPVLSIAMNQYIPTATYWTIRSMVACISQITRLLGMTRNLISTPETWNWELSSLADMVRNIHDYLQRQLGLCYRHIDEKKHEEYFPMLVRLFETSHLDNMRILQALLYSRDDDMPLLVACSSGKRVHVDLLRRRNILLLISDLNLSEDELQIMNSIYKDSQGRPEILYEVLWLPILDGWNEEHIRTFDRMRQMMPWYTVHDPRLMEPAVTKYIKEVWHFGKKMILVVLDPQGNVVCRNARHMIWIWGNSAYPFTSTKEDALWKEETWKLELLVDAIHPKILDWIAQKEVICLYGGEDIEWIRKFTTTAKGVARTAGIGLNIVYVGKSYSKDKMRRINATIAEEALSYSLPDLTSFWYFWARLESMVYSKMQHGKTVENDLIMHEAMTILSFDNSDGGWALFSSGSAEMTKTKGDMILKSLTEFGTWEENAQVNGFVPTLNNQLHKLDTPQYSTLLTLPSIGKRLILPGIDGVVPEMVICVECGRPIEK
ncbi:hypothetical protein RJ639_039041 [Escallonia herrerae]|uniref:Protein SIEVE ELEMENT OCCLUSION B-like n=1 Tax=Escallonia herrerae TaxID=1293975 RepID=A0AA88WKB8_9ASTE|nr:hypothetical protein RJ639_039041 [Escallonia herrerae]